MRAIVQRVSSASVIIEGKEYSRIGNGIAVLLGIKESDGDKEIDFMVDKLINLRIFSDHEGKLNLSLLDVKGEMLVVSNFTVYGETKKGRRPSYTDAAKPEIAEEIYNRFVKRVAHSGIKFGTGVFRADMEVNISNSGPVTLIVES